MDIPSCPRCGKHHNALYHIDCLCKSCWRADYKRDQNGGVLESAEPNFEEYTKYVKFVAVTEE